MSPRPRRLRDLERGRRAAAAAIARGGDAIDAALAAVGATFDEAAAVNALKLRVETFVRLGARHPAVRARFVGRAELLAGRTLDAAIALVERACRSEQKAFAIASALGRGNRHSLEVWRELRLILRLLRFRRRGEEFPTIVAALRAAPGERRLRIAQRG